MAARSTLTLILALALVLGALAPALPARAGGADLIALALARLHSTGAGVEPVRAEIVRVMDGYAAVRLVPPFGATDPALIILKETEGVWTAIAGPGTAFPDLAGVLPDGFFGDQSPYSGGRAQAAVNLLPAQRQTYRGAGFSLQLPVEATVTATAGAQTAFGTLRVAGPERSDGPVRGPVYEFFLTPPAGPAVVADLAGFDLMQAQIAARVAAGAPLTTPEGARLFHTPFNDVFQIDWFGGDATLSTFLLAPTGGGPAMQLVARVAPFQNDPHVFLLQAVLALAMNTLVIDGVTAGG